MESPRIPLKDALERTRDELLRIDDQGNQTLREQIDRAYSLVENAVRATSGDKGAKVLFRETRTDIVSALRPLTTRELRLKRSPFLFFMPARLATWPAQLVRYPELDPLNAPSAEAQRNAKTGEGSDGS